MKFLTFLTYADKSELACIAGSGAQLSEHETRCEGVAQLGLGEKIARKTWHAEDEKLIIAEEARPAPHSFFKKA